MNYKSNKVSHWRGKTKHSSWAVWTPSIASREHCYARFIKTFAKKAAERTGALLGWKLAQMEPRGLESMPDYVHPEFPGLYRKHADTSMVPWQGMHDAFDAARYVAALNVPGDVVESGVFRGGVSALMKEVICKAEHNSSRSFWLFDTFEGMPAPTGLDEKFGWAPGRAFRKWKKAGRRDGTSDWCRAEMSEVEATMSRTPGGLSGVNMVKGKVESTLLGPVLPESISLLRLDTDFYASTKIELEILFPRLTPGGVLIVDDYGVWSGARQAVDEYFEGHNSVGFFNRNHLNGALSLLKAT